MLFDASCLFAGFPAASSLWISIQRCLLGPSPPRAPHEDAEDTCSDVTDPETPGLSEYADEVAALAAYLSLDRSEVEKLHRSLGHAGPKKLLDLLKSAEADPDTLKHVEDVVK